MLIKKADRPAVGSLMLYSCFCFFLHTLCCFVIGFFYVGGCCGLLSSNADDGCVISRLVEDGSVV